MNIIKAFIYTYIITRRFHILQIDWKKDHYGAWNLINSRHEILSYMLCAVKISKTLNLLNYFILNKIKKNQQFLRFCK